EAGRKKLVIAGLKACATQKHTRNVSSFARPGNPFGFAQGRLRAAVPTCDSMARRKKIADETPILLATTAKLRSAARVPALREAVKSWTAAGCDVITDTTRSLLNYWLETSHKLRTGREFKYYGFQREAIETLIYVWEVEKVRTRKDLLEKYAQNAADLHLTP